MYIEYIPLKFIYMFVLGFNNANKIKKKIEN